MKKINSHKMYYVLIALCLAVLLNSCKNCDQNSRGSSGGGKYQTAISKEDSVAMKNLLIEILYPDYNNFDKETQFEIDNKNLRTLQRDYANSDKSSQPINPLTRQYSKLHFKTTYKSINTDVDTPVLQVKWTTLAPYIDIPGLNGKKDTGVGAYYVLDTSGGVKKFSYVIAKAVRNGGAITPVPFEGKFIMLIPQQPYYRLIDGNTFNIYSSLYHNNIKIINHNTFPSSYHNLSGLNHPYVCYHSGDSVFNFYDDNKDLGIDTLVIEHGSAPWELAVSDKLNITHYKLILQSPIVLFKSGGKLLLEPAEQSGFPYKRKGLDVGRLCPPQCD